jgi:hypothetical protein
MGGVAQTCGSTGPYTCPTPRCFNAPKTFEIAVAAWDPDAPTSSCSTGSDIGGCPRVCRVDVLDETMTVGGIMEGQKGHARYFAHDANYRAWVIRAGSKP